MSTQDGPIAVAEPEADVAAQVEELRQALIAARDRIVEQDTLLERLTAVPLLYATVVSVSPDGPAQATSQELRRVGTLVKLRKDSKFHVQHPDKVGKVVEDDEVSQKLVDQGEPIGSWVRVKFGKETNTYRTGLKGTADLELAEPKRVSGHAVVTSDSGFVEVELPQNLTVEPGDTVVIASQTMQIVDVRAPIGGGTVVHLRRVIDATFAEVEQQGAQVVFCGKLGKTLERGDRVILDRSGTVIVQNLKKEDERFSFSAETTVTWDAIGGLEDAKREMVEAIELPRKHAKLFAKYNKRPTKGILLYGPPGCGKTMLGKAAATSLAKLAGKSTSSGFFYVKAPEVLDRYVGVAEATIRQIFVNAREHQTKHGFPAVVFVDEADAILGKRGTGVSSDMERTIVPSFLTEMDGLEASGALVILATNRADVLDPAVVRDGRIDRRIKVGRPDRTDALRIFGLYLTDAPKSDTLANLAATARDALYDEQRVLYRVVTKDRKQHDFTLSRLVSGAMVAGVVDQATSLALHRDLEAKGKDQSGIGPADLVTAVDRVHASVRDMNHRDELLEFVQALGSDVEEIQRPVEGRLK